MKIEILAFGQKCPTWVDDGIKNYQKRINNPFQVNIVTLPIEKQTKASSLKSSERKDTETMLSKIKANHYVIAMDLKGKALTSEQMAKRLQSLSQSQSNIQLLIGGPHGLDEKCIKISQESWSLSNLTFSHPLCRLILMEALYRCQAILNNHPYHK